MSLYARILNNQIVQRYDFIKDNPPTLSPSKGDWRPLTVVDPTFDPLTQKRTGPNVNIQSSSVTETFVIVNKTAQELDADKDTVLTNFNDAILKVLFNHENRIRTLASQPSVTLVQFKAAIKALL